MYYINGCFLAFQLGFGSFLGIIGSHLIENKRQMVRGSISPLCIEITVLLDSAATRQPSDCSISPGSIRPLT